MSDDIPYYVILARFISLDPRDAACPHPQVVYHHGKVVGADWLGEALADGRRLDSTRFEGDLGDCMRAWLYPGN